MKKHLLSYYNSAKNWRDRVLDKPAKGLLSVGINADQVSWFRACLVVPMFFALGYAPWLVLVILLANYLLDGVDGVLARVSGRASIRGRALDVCIDNFYVVPLMLGLIFWGLADAFWAAFYMLQIVVSYFVNYLRFGIEVGRYPFSFSKYFVYFAWLILWLGGGNILDPVLLFWAVVLSITNLFSIVDLYYAK